MASVVINRTPVSDPTEVCKMKISPSELFNRLNLFRETEEFCDLKIKVCGSEFYAHRAVLAAFSPYFQAMFSGRFYEVGQLTILIESVESDVMKVILDYAYSNLIDVDNSNVAAIMHAASFFQAEQLLNACCDYLERNLMAENSFCIWALATLYKHLNPLLEEKARNFAVAHFTQACLENDFLELDEEAIIEMIKDDALNVEREDVVFEAVVRWLCHKKDQRFPTFDKILGHVRVALLDSVVLHDWVERLDLHQSPTCMKLVEEARMYHLLPSRRSDVAHSLRRHRNNYPTAEVMLIHQESDNGTVLNCLNRFGTTERVLSHPPVSCRHLYASGHNNVILACCWEKICRYNFESNEWYEIAVNLKPRYLFGFCELDGYWYSIGGKFVGGRTCDVVERYDPNTNVWRQLCSMPVGVAYPAVVACKGIIYVLGGVKEDKEGCNRVQRYDPRCNKWSFMPDLPSPIKLPAACILDSKIHIFSLSPNPKGDGLKKHYIYELGTGRWISNDLSHIVLGGPVAMEGCVYIITKQPGSFDWELLRYIPSVDAWVHYKNLKPVVKPVLFAGPMITE